LGGTGWELIVDPKRSCIYEFLERNVYYNKGFYGKIEGWEDYFAKENKQSSRKSYVLL
jgi:hypothetical protein